MGTDASITESESEFWTASSVNGVHVNMDRHQLGANPLSIGYFLSRLLVGGWVFSASSTEQAGLLGCIRSGRLECLYRHAPLCAVVLHAIVRLVRTAVWCRASSQDGSVNHQPRSYPIATN
jgi:hypothetical protein